ncbi:MAG: alpha/beta hydrolase [Deltaproteobacteria bacterium]|nr:alpha/beta hydrolase [Deltaproteobacteria bacterium]
MENRSISIILNGITCEIASLLRECGEELIFLLHGLGCSKESFRDIWIRDEFKNYSILAIDLPGFGESSKPDDFSYKMDDHALVCAEVLKEFSSKQLHIVAHSMGGAIGLLLPPAVLNRTLSFANLEGNLIREDCGILSRKTIDHPFHEFEKDVLPGFKVQFKSFGEGRFFLNHPHPGDFTRVPNHLYSGLTAGNYFRVLKTYLAKKLISMATAILP